MAVMIKSTAIGSPSCATAIQFHFRIVPPKVISQEQVPPSYILIRSESLRCPSSRGHTDLGTSPKRIFQVRLLQVTAINVQFPSLSPSTHRKGNSQRHVPTTSIRVDLSHRYLLIKAHLQKTCPTAFHLSTASTRSEDLSPGKMFHMKIEHLMPARLAWLLG